MGIIITLFGIDPHMRVFFRHFGPTGRTRLWAANDQFWCGCGCVGVTLTMLTALLTDEAQNKEHVVYRCIARNPSLLSFPPPPPAFESPCTVQRMPGGGGFGGCGTVGLTGVVMR